MNVLFLFNIRFPISEKDDKIDLHWNSEEKLILYLALNLRSCQISFISTRF